MRPSLPACLAALLLECVACDESPTGPPPPEPIPRPASVAAATRARNPWSAARVGDAVEYAYSFEFASLRHEAPREERQATVTLEVVALQPPWVWVQVAVKVATPALPERRFLIPVDQERVPPPPPADAVDASPGPRVKVSVGTTPVTCRKSQFDARSADGPLYVWCDADAPELYLARRIQFESRSSGHGGSHSRMMLQATRIQRGPERAVVAAAPPTGLPRLFSPEVWCRRIPTAERQGEAGLEQQEVFIGGGGLSRRRSLSRVLLTPENLKRTDLLKVADGWYRAEAWVEKPTGMLLDAVMDVVLVEGMVPGPEEAGTPGRVLLASGGVDSRTFEDSLDRKEYAKDPWAPVFDGAAWSTRWEPLVEVRLQNGREWGDRLWDCGPGPLSPSPVPEGERPDMIDPMEVSRLVKALEGESACGPPSRDAKKGSSEISVYTVEVQVEPDGSVQSVSLTPSAARPPKKPFPEERLRCLEAKLRELRFPPHRLRMPPVQTPFVLRD
ncbi:DUF6068 family protein [Pyxidicoccus sp. 3LFB2]